jgi:hypothetical protein
MAIETFCERRIGTESSSLFKRASQDHSKINYILKFAEVCRQILSKNTPHTGNVYIHRFELDVYQTKIEKHEIKDGEYRIV